MLFRFLFLTCNLFFSLGYSKIPDDISIPPQDIIPMGYLPKTSLKTPFYDFILSPFSSFQTKQCTQLLRKYPVDTCIRSFNRKEYVHSFFYLDPKTQTIQGKIWNRNSQLTVSSPYILKDVYFFPEEDSPVNLEAALTLSLKEENAFRFDIFKKVSLFLLRSGFLYSSVFQMNEFKRRIDLYGISEDLRQKIPEFQKQGTEKKQKASIISDLDNPFRSFGRMEEENPSNYLDPLNESLYAQLTSKGLIDPQLTKEEFDIKLIKDEPLYNFFFFKFYKSSPADQKEKISSAILASFIFGFVVNLLNSMVLTVDLISDDEEDEENIMHTYLHNTVIALSLLQLGFVGSEFALRGKDPKFLPTYLKEFIKGHGFHVTGKDSLSPFHQALFLIFRCPMDEIILVMLNIMSSYLFH